MFIAMFFDTAALAGFFVVIMVSAMILLGIGLTMLFVVPLIYGLRQNNILLQTGEPANAQILKIRDTGVTLNDNPQVGMLLKVYAENRSPFQTRNKKHRLASANSAGSGRFDGRGQIRSARHFKSRARHLKRGGK